MTSCLDWFFSLRGRACGGRGRLSQKPSFRVSFSTVSGHQYHCKGSVPVLYNLQQHDSRASTWFLTTTWAQTSTWLQVVDRHHHGRWQQQVSVTVQTTDMHTASSHSKDHRHHHGPWQQHKPQTSTWSMAATWPSDINMALRHQHGFQWQHRP